MVVLFKLIHMWNNYPWQALFKTLTSNILAFKVKYLVIQFSLTTEKPR